MSKINTSIVQFQVEPHSKLTYHLLMNVGVIGGAGFLGLNIMKSLAKDPTYRLSGATRKLKPICKAIPADWVELDLNDAPNLVRYLEPLDVVIYLAHEGGPNLVKNWVEESTQNLLPLQSFFEALEQLKRTKPIKVIYFSSGGAIYGRREGERQAWKETDPPLPVSSYGVLKLTSEQYFRLASLRGLCDCICLRVSNPYGNEFEHDKNQGIIDVALKKIRLKQSFTLFGEKSFVRDFIHMRDLIEAVKKCFYYHASYEIFNIGSGVGTTLGEALAQVEAVSGKKLDLNTVAPAAKVQLVPWSVLDVSKAKKLLNWEPKIEIFQGLQRLVCDFDL